MLKMCPDCTLKSRKMHWISSFLFFFFFLCHQDNFWCDLHWVNNFLHGSVNWSQKCSFSLSLFYYLFPLSHICIKSDACFPTSACRQCLQLLESGHSPSETLAKAWASARKIAGIPSDCSYKVSSPPSLPREEICAAECADLQKENISQGGFDFCNVPAVLNEQKGVFSISATSWKGKCCIFQHFLSSQFSPSLPIIHSGPRHCLELGVWHDCCTRSLAVQCLCFYLLSLGQLSANIFLCFSRDGEKHKRQDKAVVPQVAFWGGLRYLYYCFPGGTSNPQEGKESYKQPPGAAFELDLGPMRPRQCQVSPRRFWLHHQWLSLQAFSGWDSKKSFLSPEKM